MKTILPVVALLALAACSPSTDDKKAAEPPLVAAPPASTALKPPKADIPAGDYVLDNLEPDVKLWSDTHYRFLKRQASFDTGRWVTIENSDEVLVGAVEQ